MPIVFTAKIVNLVKGLGYHNKVTVFSKKEPFCVQVVGTKVGQEGQEEEDSLSTLAQALHHLKEQCGDVTRLLPGRKCGNGD